MDSAFCDGKSEDLHIPAAFLLVNNSNPITTKIYFPEPQLGTAVEREEIRVQTSSIMQQLHERASPHRCLARIPVQIPQSNTPANNRSARTKIRDTDKNSSTKDTTNRLFQEERTRQRNSITRQSRAATSCKVESPIFPDTVTKSQQNKTMQFSHKTKERNITVKQFAEALLHSDQLPCKYKYSGRGNAWKGPSYTDLITAAILSTQERKMRVSQIYNWIVQNVSYFKDREHCESFQGWKVCIKQ